MSFCYRNKGKGGAEETQGIFTEKRMIGKGEVVMVRKKVMAMVLAAVVSVSEIRQQTAIRERLIREQGKLLRHQMNPVMKVRKILQ